MENRENVQVHVNYDLEDKVYFHDYNILGATTKQREISFSDISEWTSSTRGKVAGVCKDNGNRLKITLDSGKQIKLNYHEANVMLFLLLDNMQTDFMFKKEGDTIVNVKHD